MSDEKRGSIAAHCRHETEKLREKLKNGSLSLAWATNT